MNSSELINFYSLKSPEAKLGMISQVHLKLLREPILKILKLTNKTFADTFRFSHFHKIYIALVKLGFTKINNDTKIGRQ